MLGTVLARLDACFRNSSARVIAKPAGRRVVLATGVCVAAAAITAVAVAPRLMDETTATTTERTASALTERRHDAERQTARIMPAFPAMPASEARLDFADLVPVLRSPPTLAAPDPRAWDAPRPPSVARVIAGSPSLTPPPRPTADGTAPSDGLLRLARGLTPSEARALPDPVARPETVPAAATRRLAALPAPQPVASPRPLLRPAGLSSRSPAVAGIDAVPEGATTLAARTEQVPRAPRLFGATSGNGSCAARGLHDMPRRPGGAAGGAAVIAAIGNDSGSTRDNRLIAEALRGNLPDHLRDLRPVTFDGLVGGRRTEITICVTPDYLAVGSDADHVRIPLGLPAALRVADAFDMMLPTTRMVDAIHAQADLRLPPQPMTPGAQMASTDYFARHDRTIDAQLSQAGARGGHLIAGHKKDLVLANRLSRAPGRVAIYGWHRPGGDPIQPLSTVHGEYYADYSHGIRLVSRTAYVDGRAVDLRALLTDGRYASLLNSDGPLSSATIRLAALR
jgi:hypothetical protein